MCVSCLTSLTLVTISALVLIVLGTTLCLQVILPVIHQFYGTQQLFENSEIKDAYTVGLASPPAAATTASLSSSSIFCIGHVIVSEA